MQYLDGNPENNLSEAKLGTIMVFDKDGNIIDGESFRPGGYNKLVVDGKVIKDPTGFLMAAPIDVRELFGKNIQDIKTKDINSGKHM